MLWGPAEKQYEIHASRIMRFVELFRDGIGFPVPNVRSNEV